ncbi:hypothetical protein Athai_24100 [Actinocatenispora thailandica]|uniref:N-acetyltransferase domain-containing protein n=2 Tax=Actinocatenispora thailandica TaxID=227318 RepID=A0A7R7DP36_9ACTN|nr:bifunctional pyridoxamine 5'-phosphate oxidase family protein/GNAT family N-acetyltransferase [Actinocatenispora thailandica]BCJ34907.1 hypothetical protein Athai_24100 [Actinocatenispora thailandica]
MHRDHRTIHEILDEALYCHLGYVVDGLPRVIPTVHVRIGETVYLHASTGASSSLAARDGGLPVTVAATILDGLVFARAQAHHSAPSRSVIAHGLARPVTDEPTKLAVAAALVDKLAAGRSTDSRPPNRRELAQVSILALPLTEVAAKIRPATVGDDEADLDLPYWAGVLPLRTVAGPPRSDNGVALPPYLVGWQRGAEPPRSAWLTAEPLTGERVRLEPLSLDHVDDLFEAGRDPRVWRWLSGPQPATRGEMAHEITAALTAAAAGDRVPWAQIDRGTGRAVGVTSYYEVVPAHRRLEIGYTWLGSAHWRTGHNTEAKLLLLTRAFETLGARRVSWRTDIGNERSQRAIERLGATREGVFRAHMQRVDGSLRDTVYYAMTADEWPAIRDRLRARLHAG